MGRKFFILIFLLKLLLTISLFSQDFELSIEVTDGTVNDTLIIGVDRNGTDDYDDGLDVLAPPLPPSGAFGTYLLWNDEQYYKDIRDTSTSEITFQMYYQPSTGGSIVLNWDSTGLSQSGIFVIEDWYGGSLFSLDMTTTNTLDISSYSILDERLKIKVTLYPETMTISDSTDFPSGDSPPTQIGNTDVTLDFSVCPGGKVTVDLIPSNPPNAGSLTLPKYWDIISDMTNGTFNLDLQFSYDDTDTSGLNESTLIPVYYDDINSRWKRLLNYSLDTTNNTMTVHNLDHFTIFAMGQLSEFHFILSNVKIFLEAPYGAGNMNTTLLDNGFIPLSQPYNVAPWNYTGEEKIAAIPEGIVDWILVEIRTGTESSTLITTRAAFLKSDGSIVDLDGISPIGFDDIDANSYYLVIRHRNHLIVMSQSTHGLAESSSLYNFTTGISQFYGGVAVELQTGVYGMYGGDGNGDGFINATDQNLVWRPANGTSGYSGADLNMDGFINATDRNLVWRINNGIGTNVP